MTSPSLINEQEPIFSCLCVEPAGPITRNVYPMTLSPQNIKKFWELSSNFKTLFGDEIKGSFEKFTEVLMSHDEDRIYANGLFWRIDDFIGIFYMTHIQSHDAQIHYSFFDRRHRGRVQLTRRMIKYVFDRYEFRRLSAEIPHSVIKSIEDRNDSTRTFHSGPFEFIKQVGLQEEGRKRKAILYDNEWFDVACLGILKEETDKWT